MNLTKYTTQELLLIYFNQSKKALANGVFNRALQKLKSYYDYGNYDNYDAYTNYSNYDDYTNYDNYDNYDNYNDSDGYSESSYSESGCFAKGTLITLKGGEKVKIEDLKDQEILVFDHETGKVAYTNQYFIRHLEGQFETIDLTFDDGSTFKIFDAHGIFNLDLNKYVVINSNNVSDYVGNRFMKIEEVNGIYKFSEVVLTKALSGLEKGECYSIASGTYINHVVSSLLCVSDGIDGTFNLFDYDANHKYDSVKKNEDITKYGLSTYEEWKDYVSKEEFDTFNMQYFKIAFAKNLCSIDDLKHYIKDFLTEFRD